LNISNIKKTTHKIAKILEISAIGYCGAYCITVVILLRSGISTYIEETPEPEKSTKAIPRKIGILLKKYSIKESTPNPKSAYTVVSIILLLN